MMKGWKNEGDMRGKSEKMRKKKTIPMRNN